MRKPILTATLFIAANFSVLQAQQNNPPANNPPASQNDNTVTMNNLVGLLRAQLTITPSWDVSLTSNNNSGSISGGRTNVYLHGTLEYYFTERFSMRSDGYYFVNKNKAPGGMIANHSVQIGADWHLWKNSMIDPYIGLCTGINYTAINPMNLELNPVTHDSVIGYNVPAHLDPVWAPRLGINFFGQRIFHFFIEAEYLMGNYRPSVGPILSLDEIRVSAGLGWNWVFLHKADTIRQQI